MKPNPNKGQWFILAAAILWGTTGTAQAFAPASAQPASIGAMRLVVGGAALLLFAAARGVLRDGKPWPLLPTLISAGSMAAYQPFFFDHVQGGDGCGTGNRIGAVSAALGAGVALVHE